VYDTEKGELLAVLLDAEIIGKISVGEDSALSGIDDLLAGGARIFNQLDTHSIHWPPGTNIKIISLLKQMHREYTERPPYWQLAIKSLATQLFVTALRKFPEKKNETLENNRQILNIQAAIEYIAVNYKKNILLSECAVKIGYNSSYFSRFFRKNMGISFKKYVNSVKVEQAKWLLLTTQMPIIDICYESGFSDVGTFNRIFKTIAHKSPSEFKKNQFKKPNFHRRKNTGLTP
jgi:YesN/AraC family two-component response regulator